MTVGPSNRIVFADDRMPAVLATPWLVAHLEYAARAAIAPCLDDHERSVGTFIEVEHLAPVPEGFTVVCRARVIHVDGPRRHASRIDAHDGGEEPVARPRHPQASCDRRGPVRPAGGPEAGESLSKTAKERVRGTNLTASRDAVPGRLPRGS